jgi:hypothetical protein
MQISLRKRRYRLGDPSVDGRIILKRLLKKRNKKVRNGLNWPGTSYTEGVS